MYNLCTQASDSELMAASEEAMDQISGPPPCLAAGRTGSGGSSKQDKQGIITRAAVPLRGTRTPENWRVHTASQQRSSEQPPTNTFIIRWGRARPLECYCSSTQRKK